MKKIRIWRHSGIFLVLTGTLHTLVALLLNGETYLALLKDGIIDSVGDDPSRAFAFWFLICGVFLLFFGYTLHYYIRREQEPAPLFLGYGLLIFSLIGCLFEPVSGCSYRRL